MKAMVIGYGSIGARHARLLRSLGCQVAVVSRRDVDAEVLYRSAADAYQSEKTDYVVVASRTHEHLEQLQELADMGFSGSVLVEKPIFHEPLTVPANQFKQLFVGYNLRFHPVIKRLREEVSGRKILSAQIYAGHYLPNWRTDRDYRESYSSHKEQGGGVLRDYSHELDYANWVFGAWEKLVAIGGHFSSLEISSDDCFSILMSTEKSPVVSIHLNYLDREKRRTVVVQCDHTTIKADLVNGFFEINGKREAHQIDLDQTYLDQHRAILSGHYEGLCSAQAGLEVVSMIQAIERSAEEQVWVSHTGISF